MDYDTLVKSVPAGIGIAISQVSPVDAGSFFEKYGVPLAMLVVTIYAIVYQEMSRTKREVRIEEQRVKRESLEREERELEREQRKLEREMSERQLNKKTEELQASGQWLRERYDELISRLVTTDTNNEGPKFQ